MCSQNTISLCFRLSSQLRSYMWLSDCLTDVVSVFPNRLWALFGQGCAYLSEKAMATHSSTLAWETPWMEEPGRLQSMGSRRVRYNWATSLSLFTFMHWRRKWQPTPVFLPGESQGWEHGGLPSMGSHRGGHDWRDLAAAAVPICAHYHIPLSHWR